MFHNTNPSLLSDLTKPNKNSNHLIIQVDRDELYAYDPNEPWWHY